LRKTRWRRTKGEGSIDKGGGPRACAKSGTDRRIYNQGLPFVKGKKEGERDGRKRYVEGDGRLFLKGPGVSSLGEKR